MDYVNLGKDRSQSFPHLSRLHDLRGARYGDTQTR